MASRPSSWSSALRRPLVVLIVGVVATLALAAWADAAHRSNEAAVLDQRADDAVQTLSAVLPLLQVPLSSGLAVAEEADDPAQAFERTVDRFVGPGRLMASASLWRRTAEGPERLASVGETSTLDSLGPAAQERHLDRVPSTGIGVLDLTDAERRAVGFAGAGETDPTLVAYLEAPIPDDPTALDLTGNAFDDLDIEVHLGTDRSPERRLFATTTDLPLPADAPTRRIPWGDAELLLAFSPRGELSDPLLADLSMAIAITGLSLAVFFTLLALRLERSKRTADEIADVTAGLYLEQRVVAHRLQHDLLPDPLPTHPGVRLASRYEAGSDGIEIGGDWYDVVPVDADHVLFSVGDVSGQGLPAASIMVALRAGIRAYAMEGHGPADILQKLGRLLDVRADGHFATVLCGCVHVRTSELVLATAGHPPPVLASPLRTELLELEVGFPIGVSTSATYEERVVPMTPDDTLVAFTDGLFERRGERVDHALLRVRGAVEQLRGLPLDELVHRLVEDLGASSAPDDTAVLALRTVEPASAARRR